MNATKSDLLKRVLKRRTFCGLMELYETNYRLLYQLVPDPGQLPAEAVSRVPGSPDLHLKVEERSRFTTTLAMTHYFEEDGLGQVANPDVQIRIYHDARQVEILACRPRGFRALGEGEGGQVDCRWDSNVFLEKWLRYSLRQGHGFGRHHEAGNPHTPQPAPVS
jgi:hypothetical protein